MDLVTHPKKDELAGPVGSESRSAEIGTAFEIAEQYYKKAVCAYKNRSILDAISALEEVLRNDPAHKDAEYRLECYRQELDDLKKDVEELRLAISDNPSDAKSRLTFAESLHSLGCIDEAVRQFQQVAEQSDQYLSKRAKRALSRI